MNATYVSLVLISGRQLFLFVLLMSARARVCAPNAESHSVRLGDYPSPIGAKTMTSESGQ